MGRWLKWSLGAVLVLTAVLGISVFAAGTVFDRQAEGWLQKLAARVPGLALRNEPRAGGVRTRTGTLYFTYQLPEGNPLGTRELTGAADYELHMGLLTAVATVTPLYTHGNLRAVLERFHVMKPDLKAVITGSLPQLSVQARLSCERLLLPLPQADCELAPWELTAVNRGVDGADLRLSLPQLSCRGTGAYAGRAAFSLDARGLELTASPAYRHGRVEAEEVRLDGAEILAEVATMYAMGFAPDEPVRDPTLRDAVSLRQFSVTGSARDPDPVGRRTLGLSGRGTLSWAFPAVAEGQPQPPVELSAFECDLTVARVQLARLLNLLRSPPADLAAAVAGVLSPETVVTVKRLGVNYHGGDADVTGQARVRWGDTLTAMPDGAADGSVRVSRALAEAVLTPPYREQLALAVAAGTVGFDGRDYRTQVKFSPARGLTLNGLPVGWGAGDADAGDGDD